MSASFSQQVKTELCALPLKRSCCIASELYGSLLLCNTFSSREIRIITVSAPFAGRFCELMRLSGYGSPNVVRGSTGKHSIVVTEKNVLECIFEAYGYDPVRQISLHLNGWVIERECCRQAFLRGAFLAGGFLVDPEKQYRLEIITPHEALGRELSALLVDMDLPPKMTKRQGCNVIYYKESSNIEDFLTHTGAYSSVLHLMEAKLMKDVRNTINRRVNCETSNLYKTVESGQSQIENINYLISRGVFDDLSDELRETARLRLDNPDLSLSELTLLVEQRISRSGLNRRLQKINEYAARHREL